MSYQLEISNIRDITVEDVIRISTKYVPSKYRHAPWRHPDLDHGVALLDNEDALNAYIAAYGEMHMIKCRSVFRNLPFESFANIEVFDWGCGQGIGTICLAEMMRDRDMLHLLKKVTLIEPSSAALKRAILNVNTFTKGNARIIPINKYLPSIGGDMDNCIEGVSSDYNTIIHIFSNILDINNIDIIKLAKLLPKIGTNQYIVCIGPKNANSNRIELFAKIFSPSKYITNIDNPSFGTTKTHHHFGCNARAFHYTNQPFDTQTLEYVSKHITHTSVCDDYDFRLAKINKLIHPKATNLTQYLIELLNDDDLIFYDTTIEGEKIDILILRPNCGIFIIQVFDYDITDFLVFKNAESKSHLLLSGDEEMCLPINVLKQLKDSLIKLHIKHTSTERLNNRHYWNIIKTIGFFPQNTTNEVDNFFARNEIKHEYEICIGNDITQTELKKVLKGLFFFQSNRSFTSACKNDFIQIISPGWHSYREGIQLNLTNDQKRLSKSTEGIKQKIKGIAGSGKTEVLVNRAVKAQERTGKEVLILTYNLSLRNYIRQRLSQVRADFSWDKFYITNYHQFIKSAANNLSIDLSLGSFDNEFLFDDISGNTSRYSAIFIDEIQDYKPVWLKIINKYFLASGGELVVFGDPKQRVYENCEIDKNGDIKIGVIPGTWNGELLHHLRFSNRQLSSLADSFAQQFLEKESINTQQTLDFDCISYIYYDTFSYSSLLTDVLDLLKNKEVDINDDFVILAETHNFIRRFEKEYINNQLDRKTCSTSESQEQYDALLYGEKYNGNANNPLFENDIKTIQRAKKMHFSMDSGCLKLSTIQSFKGWDAEIVLLFIEHELGSEFLKPENIYTGITRAKSKLFIINLGNSYYDEFFSKYVNTKNTIPCLDLDDIF